MGCGKGETLVRLSKFPFKNIAGVELSDSLYEIAQQNLRIIGTKKIKLFHCNAVDFTDFDSYNYIYMFNPFPENIMKEVVINIENSLYRMPRKLTIIYSHPKFHSTIDSSKIIKFARGYDIKYKQFDLKVFIYNSHINN